MLKTLTFAETSPAAPGTAASAAVVIGSAGPAGVAALAPVSLETFTALTVVAQLVGATGGTLDVYLQTSPDAGLTWVDYAHLAQLAAGAGAIKYAFAVSQSGQLPIPVAVGVGLAPALGAGVVVGGAWGDRFRLVMVAGAATTAGAPVSVTITAQKP